VLESRYIEPFAKNIAATTCFELLTRNSCQIVLALGLLMDTLILM
jgi:hypothetical protein